MTLVVVERHGSVAIFTQASDGTLRQRGLFDVDDFEATHLELAELGENLSRTFGWNGVDVSRPVSKRVAKTTAKPVGKAKQRALPPELAAAVAANPAPTPKARRVYRGDLVPPGYRSLPRGRSANELRPALIAEVVEYVRANPGATTIAISQGTRIYERTVVGLVRRDEVDASLRFEQANPIDARRYYVRDLDAN